MKQCSAHVLQVRLVCLCCSDPLVCMTEQLLRETKLLMNLKDPSFINRKYCGLFFQLCIAYLILCFRFWYMSNLMTQKIFKPGLFSIQGTSVLLRVMAIWRRINVHVIKGVHAYTNLLCVCDVLSLFTFITDETIKREERRLNKSTQCFLLPKEGKNHNCQFEKAHVSNNLKNRGRPHKNKSLQQCSSCPNQQQCADM